MMGVVLIAVAFAGVIGWWLGRARAQALAAGRAMHSRPAQHGAFVAVAAVAPALLVVALWALAGRACVDSQVLALLPADGASAARRSAFLAEVHGLVDGSYTAAFSPAAEQAARRWAALYRQQTAVAGGAALALALAGGAWGWSRVSAGFRARTWVERLVVSVLALASLVALLVTFGIVASLVVESWRFFRLVPPLDFLTGRHWSPEGVYGSDRFGAVPLFWGTAFIGLIIAMLVAVPLGLMAAIYLTQYAAPGLRRAARPMLEILAGIPTVVYGFFAALMVAPLVRDAGVALGVSGASGESALAAGLVVGIMMLPFVASTTDDALAAVPAALGDGSLALGATRAETVVRVLVPAALPDIIGGILLAASRAIGETMIVVMAAGMVARITANPLLSVTTVPAQIVALLTGDQDFDGRRTLAAFALGLVLFLVTLLLNIYAFAMVKWHRGAYG
jgi:phosphate transport system permease protein